MTNLEVMQMAKISEEDQIQCANYADKAGLNAEETAKAYYLSCISSRDSVLFFADLMLEKLEEV